MKLRNTLILALIVAGFGAYLYLVERPKAEKEAAKKTVVEVDRSQIEGIDLKYPDREIKLAKVDGAWRLTAPIEAEADQSAVQNLIGAIADAELKKTLEDGASNLTQYGLDQPVAVITVHLADGKTLPPIALGKTTPIGYGAYARRGDEKDVLLTTAAFQTGAKKEVKDLRDKTVLAFQDDDVQEIRLQNEGGETVVRKEAEGWALVKPTPAKADTAQVRGLLSTLRSLRALDFVDGIQATPDAKYGLTPPRLTITLIVGSDRAEKKLLFGGGMTDPSKKEIYVQRGDAGPIVTVGDYALTSLSKKPADLRDKTVIAFDKDKLSTVSVKNAAGEDFTLEKKGEGWTLQNPGSDKVKDLVAQRFVDDVRGLKGADIAAENGPAKSFGLDRPAVTIELKGTDGTSAGTIRLAQVGTGADKKIYVAADGSPIVYTLNDYVFQRVDKHRSDFIDTPRPSPSAAASAPAAGAVAAPAAVAAPSDDAADDDSDAAD
jgi:hypothetical protein